MVQALNSIPFGESAVLNTWQDKVNDNLLDRILYTKQLFNTLFGDEIIEMVNTYNSLCIYLKAGIDPFQFSEKINSLDLTAEKISLNQTLWKIPICFDDEFALDLPELLIQKKLSKEFFRDLFTQPKYRIHFIGFLPGFTYLGGLNPVLSSARKSSPRLTVPTGSVGIANEQTGIYPQQSPGGWQIIGQTPLEIFNVSNQPPSPFQSGDNIQFYDITINEFDKISKKPLDWNDYKIQFEC